MTLQEKLQAVKQTERVFTYAPQSPKAIELFGPSVSFRFKKLTEREFWEIAAQWSRYERQLRNDASLKKAWSQSVMCPAREVMIENILAREGLGERALQTPMEAIQNALNDIESRINLLNEWIDASPLSQALLAIRSEVAGLDNEEFLAYRRIEGEPVEGVVERHLQREKQTLAAKREARKRELEAMREKDLAALWSEKQWESLIATKTAEYALHLFWQKEIDVSIDGQWIPLVHDPKTIREDLFDAGCGEIYEFLVRCHAEFNAASSSLMHLALYSPFRF
ncbi:MAG: hypothetical protein QXI19_13440 [Candidatus Caldarchaeum sp.]